VKLVLQEVKILRHFFVLVLQGKKGGKEKRTEKKNCAAQSAKQQVEKSKY
jgi:hypothetical protein